MSLQLAFTVFENVQSIHPLTIDNSKNDGLGTWKPQSVPRKMDLHFCAISLAYFMIFQSEAAMWNLKNYLKLNKKNIYLIYILIITYIISYLVFSIFQARPHCMHKLCKCCLHTLETTTTSAFQILNLFTE